MESWRHAHERGVAVRATLAIGLRCSRGLYLFLLLTACGGAGDTEPAIKIEGAAKGLAERAVTASTFLQTDAPVEALSLYLVGFHPMKAEPMMQLEVHHFCNRINEDFWQCALFDGNTRDANLTGVEYIVSARLFQTLDQDEKKSWHPLNGAILSGHLVAPGLPGAAEQAVMKDLMNAYGKSWHFWQISQRGPLESLPVGAPYLGWSFNREGELQDDILRERDRRLGIDMEAQRKARTELRPLARPQQGVDLLKNRFKGVPQLIPGVVEQDAGERRDEQQER